MMRHTLFVLLVGCSMDLETFSTEFSTEACAYAAVCGGTIGSDALCEDAFSVAVDDLDADDGCEYRPRQATQCISELTADTCDEKTAVYYECKRVFRGDGCELDVFDALY